MEDLELKKYLKRLSDASKPSRIVVNAIINGIFTALGATVGFALVVIFLAYFLSTLKNLPIIDQLIKETKIDQLINSQLQKLEDESGASVQVEYIAFDSFSFKYPYTYVNASYLDSSGNSVVQLSGGSNLKLFKITKEKDKLASATVIDNITLTSVDGVTREVEKYTLQDSVILLYEYQTDIETFYVYGYIKNDNREEDTLTEFSEILFSIKPV